MKTDENRYSARHGCIPNWERLIIYLDLVWLGRTGLDWRYEMGKFDHLGVSALASDVRRLLFDMSFIHGMTIRLPNFEKVQFFNMAMRVWHEHTLPPFGSFLNRANKLIAQAFQKANDL